MDAVKLSKQTIKDIQNAAQGRYKDAGPRLGRAKDYEDIYKMDWDLDLPEGDWVQDLPSPEGHNAVKGIVRLMVGTQPAIKVDAEAPDVTYKEYAEDCCRMLLRTADRRGPWMISYDLAMSAALFGECYVRTANVEDNITFLQKRNTGGGLAKRYARLAKSKPFLFRAYSPRQVMPTWSDLGLESVFLRMERPIDDVAAFWGKSAVERVSPFNKTESEAGHLPTCVYWEYCGHDYRLIWIEGQEDKPMFGVENELGFINWSGSIVEGSSLFDKEEDQRLPMFYPVLRSGYYHAQSYADSIMYSLALTIGKLPQMKGNFNNPKQSVEDLMDWSTPLGVMRLGLGEQLEMFDKRVIDESLNVASNLAGTRMSSMLIPKQVLGESPENVMAFSSLNLLVQAGRLPLVPVQRMVGVVMGQMLELPFLWAKTKKRAYRLPSFDRPLMIDPKDYENVTVDVEIRAQFGSDDAQKVSIAANAIAAQLWSQERAMEYTGVDDPLRERGKIDDDFRRRANMQARAQGDAILLAQIAQNASLVAAGAQQVHPSQVEYRPADDPVMVCGNCQFFQGPGVPCARVNVAVNPFFTCMQWKPNPQVVQAQQAPQDVEQAAGMAQPGMGEGMAAPPPITNPNAAEGGGGMPPIQETPGMGREAATGRDMAGNLITGGMSMPLG